METFATSTRADAADAIAPDGAEVRLLCNASGGSMALFTLAPGAVSRPVAHHSVEEVWYVVGGRGRMWRKSRDREEITVLGPGVSIGIPPGTHFQFRNDGGEPLEAVAVTMPPWPGAGEAYAVAGHWAATV